MIQRDEVLRELRSHGPAVFVTELLAGLPSNTAKEPLDLERALNALERDGLVVIRDHYCGDPHLEGEDLRVVGLIEPVENQDSISRCVQVIESTWSEWLAAYLADHRCV